jgi:5-methylcytosine-specific restriction endonuclease McrA
MALPSWRTTMAVETVVCSECGHERPNRGTCRSCGTRLCCTCRVELPKERRSGRCSECDRLSSKRFRQENPDYSSQKSGEWRIQNPERQKELYRKWKEANPGRDQENHRAWRKANSGRVKSYHRNWYEENRESVIDRNRTWRLLNPEKDRMRHHRRRAKKNGCVVSQADVAKVIERSGGLCSLCRAYVPEDLRHIDHIIPLHRGGPHSQENLQLLCYRCNSSKGAKLPGEVEPETWTKTPAEDQPFLLNPNWR